MLSFSYVVNSIFNSITYVIPTNHRKDCWIVDCGDVEKVIDFGWKVVGVLLTHSHYDHIYGLNKLLERFPSALVYTNAAGKDGLQNPKWNFSRYHTDVEDFIFEYPDNVRVIADGDVIFLNDNLKVSTLMVPGHEPSCVAYMSDDCIFTGDAYIPGVKVVDTFPRSNKELAQSSLDLLWKLEEQGKTILPGHWIEKER